MFFVRNFHDTLNSDVLVKASFYKHFKTSTERKQASRLRPTVDIFKEENVLTEVVSCACAVSLVGGGIVTLYKNQSYLGNPLQRGIII